MAEGEDVSKKQLADRVNMLERLVDFDKPTVKNRMDIDQLDLVVGKLNEKVEQISERLQGLEEKIDEGEEKDKF